MMGLCARNRVRGNRGISLIEVVALIVIVAIIAATVLKSMRPGMENARKRKTEREMEMIMKAIIGDPSVMSVAGGVRSDFGYVGDVGAFPPNLDALVGNPGGYATWDGPYIPADYVDGFKTDEWGREYIYDGTLGLTTSGSGNQFHRNGGLDTTDILRNTVSGLVLDSENNEPGADIVDDVEITIMVPNGTGGLSTTTVHPGADGSFSFSSIAMGQHLIKAVYTPEVDTLARYITVLPRHSTDELVRFNFASEYFGDTSGGASEESLTLVEGTESASGASCQDVSFDIVNNTGSSVNVTTLQAAWSGVTAYYQTIRWDGTIVYTSGSTRTGTGQTVNIGSQTVANGQTVTVVLEEFRDKVSGSSSGEPMGGVAFQIEFSDGSQIVFTSPSCP